MKHLTGQQAVSRALPSKISDLHVIRRRCDAFMIYSHFYVLYDKERKICVSFVDWKWEKFVTTSNDEEILSCFFFFFLVWKISSSYATVMEGDSSTNIELRQSSSSKQTPGRSVPKTQRQESSTSSRKNSDTSAKSSIKKGLPSTASVRSGLEAGQTTQNGMDYYNEARRAVENQNRETFDTPVLESKPPNYLWLALFTTVFCNPLTGIVAMVMASK